MWEASKASRFSKKACVSGKTSKSKGEETMRERLQQFGGFLAGMVIPNIGAFIAWGLITALFIPTGWIPNENFAKLVGPMILYLLPILIGYTGGKMVHGVRGGVVGAAATMGVVVGSDIPMFLGAMIMGPFGGWAIKKIDEMLEERVGVGFEMLVNNFSAGILALVLVLLGFVVVGPLVTAFSNTAGAIVDALIKARLLPLAAIIIEPAKVLFLNNALNHGVLAPLGVAATQANGRAIHFLLETDPGPGLGLLVAFYVAGKGMLKESAPGSMIIHFLGGIHEIYFPYVLAHPIMILAMIAGGFAADLWFVISGAGLVATPSPGSIFAYLAVIPPGQHFQVLTGVLIGAVVSFLVGSFILRVRPVREEESEETAAPVAVPGLSTN
jgi:mannitol PTS system EIICBA or EIICB component